MSVNPSGADTGIFRDKQVNAMDADALTPCIAMTSATMVMTMRNKQGLVFHEEENTNTFILMTKKMNTNTFIFLRKKIQISSYSQNKFNTTRVMGDLI